MSQSSLPSRWGLTRGPTSPSHSLKILPLHGLPSARRQRVRAEPAPPRRARESLGLVGLLPQWMARPAVRCPALGAPGPPSRLATRPRLLLGPRPSPAPRSLHTPVRVLVGSPNVQRLLLPACSVPKAWSLSGPLARPRSASGVSPWWRATGPRAGPLSGSTHWLLWNGCDRSAAALGAPCPGGAGPPTQPTQPCSLASRQLLTGGSGGSVLPGGGGGCQRKRGRREVAAPFCARRPRQ